MNREKMRRQVQILRNKKIVKTASSQNTVITKGVVQHVTPVPGNQKPKNVTQPPIERSESRRKQRLLQQQRELIKKRKEMKMKQQRIASVRAKIMQDENTKKVQKMSVSPPKYTPSQRLAQHEKRLQLKRKGGCGGCKRKRQ